MAEENTVGQVLSRSGGCLYVLACVLGFVIVVAGVVSSINRRGSPRKPVTQEWHEREAFPIRHF